MNTAIAETLNLLPNYGQIAFYLRLSMADGDLGNGKDESNSIENQRLLLQEYVRAIISCEYSQESLDDYIIDDYISTIAEYVDDGYSGTNFDRPSFKKMINDAKLHKINTLIVKDTSRLGRDYIEVGDYMEQIFPLLGVRFIAVNSNYDSNRYSGTTMGLENSVMNLINAEYSRDLSRKINSAHHALWSKGISTAGQAPYGYVVVNRKYEIDHESAEIVRLIFDKAIQGWQIGMIVNLLNENNIPAPGKYKNYQSKSRKVTDKEWLWDYSKVAKVIKNFSYTGSMVHGKSRCLTACSKSRRTVEEKDRYILPNTHKGIVSEDEWYEAQKIFRTVKKAVYKDDVDFVLKGKIRCGNCGLTMEYSERTKTIHCSHVIEAGRASTCDRTRHEADKIISLVAGELHRQIKVLEFFGLQIERSREERRKAFDYTGFKRNTESQIEIQKAEKIRQYEAYAEGVIQRDEYLNKKNEIESRIKELEEKLHEAGKIQAEETALTTEIETVVEDAERMNEKRKGKPLTREMVLAFIDTVRIYDKDTVEITFRFDDVIQRAMDYVEKREIVLKVG